MEAFSLFHYVLFGKTKFHLFSIMDISFWNKMFKGYCSQIDPYVIWRISLNVFGLLFSQIQAYELSAITLYFPLQHVFFSLWTVLYISTHSAVEHPGQN